MKLHWRFQRLGHGSLELGYFSTYCTITQMGSNLLCFIENRIREKNLWYGYKDLNPTQSAFQSTEQTKKWTLRGYTSDSSLARILVQAIHYQSIWVLDPLETPTVVKSEPPSQCNWMYLKNVSGEKARAATVEEIPVGRPRQEPVFIPFRNEGLAGSCSQRCCEEPANRRMATGGERSRSHLSSTLTPVEWNDGGVRRQGQGHGSAAPGKGKSLCVHVSPKQAI